MQVRTTDTARTEALSIIDPETGCNWIADFVGNTGALSDGQFVRAEDGVFECDQATLDWWQAVITRQQAADDRVHALKAEFGGERVYRALDGVGSVDFEYVPGEMMAALDAEFGED